MDLLDVLATHSLLDPTVKTRLIFACSHSTMQHVPVLVHLIRDCLSGGAKSSSATWFNADDQISTASCLFLCTQHSSQQFYRRLLPSGLDLAFIDLYSRDLLFGEGDADLIGRVNSAIKSQTSQLVDSKPHRLIVAIDNITPLLDLGFTATGIDRLLIQLSAGLQDACQQLILLVGCHSGDAFDGKLEAPDLEPTFVHCVSLWVSRASLLLDIRPLATGYSSFVDGELTISRPNSRDNLSTSSSPHHRFHFTCRERGKVLCYATGKSDLIS